jgi:hypothetical protein
MLRIIHVPTGITAERRLAASSRAEADAGLLQARPELLREIEERLNVED